MVGPVNSTSSKVPVQRIPPLMIWGPPDGYGDSAIHRTHCSIRAVPFSVFLIFRTLNRRSQQSIERAKARKWVMVPYSIDLRERVLMAVDASEGTQEEIAERFRVSARWIPKLLARRAATGSIAPEPNRGGRKLLIQGEAADVLRTAIREA